MTISDLAGLLLDDSSASLRRGQLDLFSTMDKAVIASFEPNSPEVAAVTTPAPGNGAYMVASRLGRANYEDNAKKEAILHALQSIRGPRHNNGRVIRST